MSSPVYEGNYKASIEHALEASDYLIKQEEETRNNES